MLIKNILLIIICTICLSPKSLISQAPLPRITLVEVFNDLDEPVCLASCGDDRIFIVEKSGIIKIGYPDGFIREEPFLDIKDIVKSGGERGLLGLDFPPDFKQTGNFYVNYTGEPDGQTVISRFKIAPDSNKAVAATEEILLEITQPASNHNGGCIEFGSDGYLYIGMGDGGGGGDPQNYSQTKNSLLGKMLRIDVSPITGYVVPPDNPFVDDPSYEPEIWAMGLRNPWRFNFDQRNGDLWIADVGQGSWEEVNFEKLGTGGGKNYGWRCYEGYAPYNSSGCQDESFYTFPVAAFPHGNSGNCSITGGVVSIKDTNSSLYGYYLSVDYCSGRFWGTVAREDNEFETIELLRSNEGNFVSFGYDKDKNIYVAADGGSIFRIDTFVLCTNDLAISGSNDHIGCGLDSVTLAVESFTGGTYTWYRNGIAINNSDTDTLAVTVAGQYSVQYVSDECSAQSLQSFDIIKNEDIEVTLLDLPEEYCVDGAPLELHGDPVGGEFTGLGIEGNIFNPALSNVGTFSITYYYEDEEGCSGFDVKTIKVNRESETEILSSPPDQCLQGPPLELLADPTEGSFSGNGISGNTFYPQVAGVGVHKIIYTYTPIPGCSAKDSIYIKVLDCTSGTNDIDKSQYEVYPNPVKNDLMIRCQSISNVPTSVKILNQLGMVVQSQELKSGDRVKDQYSINISELPAGSYMIILEDMMGQYVKKIIKI